MSSIPMNKQALYDSIQHAYDKLSADYKTIPDSYSRKTGVEGNVKGTEISVCDTLAYLIGWGKLVLKWHKQTSIGQPVTLPATGYKWNQLGKLAQHFHAHYKDWSYPCLLHEFKVTTNKILTLVNSLTEEELYGDNWYRKYTLGRMIQFNTTSPMRNMRTRVRTFKKKNELM
ncbi:ClbS/DfsB family four-helix bundle protein [uncultured Microbulbifer sp.]|uniref:ClbS/DfsB family four-helix bundle protein n=1 Tax=uncultured Microbulbifer sp. TaxID=348147 RepID=UPI002605339F|nr:ClbS/DfsB family four-helix bundle protein [uncultured Microbulbifer sp.]